MIDFLPRAQALAPQLVDWRRDFQQHPELGFHEVRTAGIVARHLQALGIEIRTGVGKTGVVGIIEGAAPGPTVLLRFDMDALPVLEATGLPFASENEGLMHACGHDAHTAIGMGVASLLASTAVLWPGRVKLLFQPAEEGLGGALATIRDGVLRDPSPQAAFGVHLWNPYPSGHVYVRAGPLMAAADRFTITITGKGGHGALPHTTVDAVHVAAQAVNALHTIVSRNLPPYEAAVLTIGSFHAGVAFNVIAEQACLTGTLRSFNPEVRGQMILRMEEVLAGTCAAHGASYLVELADHTPAVINDAHMAKLAAAAAAALVNPDRLGRDAPLMVAEDFAEIAQVVPSCYLLVGAEPPGGALGGHHSPGFDIDETSLPLAAALMASIAVRYLLRSLLAGPHDGDPAA